MLLKNIVKRGKEDDEVWQADSRAVLGVAVGEETALPIPCVSVLPAFLRGALHQVAELTSAANEEDDAAAIRYVCGKVQRQLEMLHGLLEIDYILFQAATVQIRLHKPEKE